VTFDDENIYFAVKCYHSDPDRIIATELRRDSSLAGTAADDLRVRGRRI